MLYAKEVGPIKQIDEKDAQSPSDDGKYPKGFAWMGWKQHNVTLRLHLPAIKLPSFGSSQF